MLLLLLAPALAGERELAGYDPVPGERVYLVDLDGRPAGSARSELRRAEGLWLSTQRFDVPVASQMNETRFEPETLRPLSMTLTSTQAGFSVVTRLSMEGATLVMDAPRREAKDQRERIEVEVPAGTVFPGMEEHLLVSRPLSAGAGFSIPSFDPVSRQVRTLEFRVTGRERVSVPAGVFEAWRVEISGGAAPGVAHVRVGRPLLVRLQVNRPAEFTFKLEVWKD
ncbi:MAG: hypothetical protein ACREKN_09155 [Longimicrobiaceae bacterium]